MKKICLMISVLLLLFLTVGPVCAQIPKTDAVKSPSKLSTFFADVKAKGEKAVQWVSNSKMGKLVGKGIKAAKAGVKFAKAAYTSAMAIYAAVGDAIDDIKDSKELKIAKLTKQITSESKKTLGYQKQKTVSAAETKEKIALVQKNAEAKVQNLENNKQVMLSSLTQEQSNNGNEEDLQTKTHEIEESIKAQIEQIQADMEAEVADLQDTQEETEDDLNEKMKTSAKKVAELTKELGKVADIKVTIEKPEEAVSKTQEEVFLKPEQKPTLKNQEELREKRFSNRRDSLYSTTQQSLERKTKLTGDYEKVQVKKDLTDTMPGESEGSGVHVEVLVAQLEMLQNYTNLILQQLEIETTVEAAQFVSIDAPAKLDKFSLCKYADPPKSLFDKLKDTAKSVKKSVNKAKEKVADVKEKVNDVKGAVNDVKEVSGAVKDLSKDPSAIGGMI